MSFCAARARSSTSSGILEEKLPWIRFWFESCTAPKGMQLSAFPSRRKKRDFLGEIAPRDKKTSTPGAVKTSSSAKSTKKAAAGKKEVKWIKATIRLEESFFLEIKDKLARKGRILQGYIDYLEGGTWKRNDAGTLPAKAGKDWYIAGNTTASAIILP